MQYNDGLVLCLSIELQHFRTCYFSKICFLAILFSITDCSSNGARFDIGDNPSIVSFTS